ncbi:unnamed protein product [Caenorhabditis auriculariae]|uniref:Uncharacterized protein n=1 Tax=Caenorhabditis auriculariae TaxID=2777116 RepID=A0A8S1HQM0_9PELO|nr:unnamed protein product [Caenorhabditis auriculariae]
MHRQLFHALLVQASVPLFVSFLPCGVSCLAPAFNIDLRSHLLTCFAIFDILYSVFDIFAPLTQIQHKKTLCALLISDFIGPKSQYAKLGMITRAASIGLTFGILEIHFFYRYLLLCRWAA